ncbi:MAG: efflux RND transporter periplasmic adaptor subunit, partial [Candidatus Hydrogenedentes bacterium]|nr:efflux RND transporter periplasmic adaptor subunit [Candidatus Hydrogenedentota bacterium]
VELAVTVEVAEVERGRIRETVRYVGSVEAYDSVTVLPKVTGILESMEVDIGDSVSKGDLLATIDDAEFAQRVEQAKANLKLAEARLQRSRINLASAERELARTGALVSEDLAPEQQLDLAAAQRDAARADVDLGDAEVARAGAALNEAQINLDNTRIVAQLSGYVDKRRVDPGALVSPATPLCTIVRTDPAKVVINVPENDISLLKVGQAGVVKVGADDLEHHGRISRIAPTVDIATRTTMAELIVPNAEGTLRPGMYADVLLVAREKADALNVPEAAIIRRNGQTDVLRVVDDVARTTRITLGILGEGYAEVIDGLEEGDTVVTKGQYVVKDGDRVRYQSAAEQAPETA